MLVQVFQASCSFGGILTSILWAKLSWRHMGAHSGIAPLVRAIEMRQPGSIQTISGTPNAAQVAKVLWERTQRACGMNGRSSPWAQIRESGVPFYGHQSWNVERRILDRVRANLPDWVVLPGVEDQLFLLASGRKQWSRTRLAGISHQPPSWWELKDAHAELVRGLDLLIVLSSPARRFWESRVDSRKIIFIPHGVDTAFFRPAARPPQRREGLRVVTAGQYLRDFETLSEVVAAAARQSLPVHFDVIASEPLRGLGATGALSSSGNVTWHTRVSDKRLRTIYQQADLLLLLLKDGTANNSLLEGLACGLPAVVTDVGGVRDYTTRDFADYVQPRNAGQTVEMLNAYVNHQRLALPVRGAAARRHAETHLSWGVVASRFLAALEQDLRD